MDVQIKGEGVAKRRKFVELRIPSTGKVEYFDCRTRNDKRALERALAFVQCAQERHGETLYWKFRGENMYRIGANHEICRTMKQNLQKTKEWLMEYFFDIA
ncbi:DUF6018 family natural product bioysynthesis protein [Bacillus sp. SM2101]|uniref:DUF6018 family natural product bioysynthesis protein n=1 Tax=Bacillus sp. SM2101 TaxID=2805366 RepID=UPI001BDF08B8|nr:DUF6018 family natural product bioysynthesis protein [Bacillus sp. SM2101]